LEEGKYHRETFETSELNTGFEVLAAVVMKNSTF
jgi:hypothetical protein